MMVKSHVSRCFFGVSHKMSHEHPIDSIEFPKKTQKLHEILVKTMGIHEKWELTIVHHS